MNVERLAKHVDTHAAALDLFAARWTCAPEDCVQEAMLELAQRPVEPANVRAWLYRVVKNRALNAARGQRRRREREETAMRLRPSGGGHPFADPLAAEDLSEALDQLEPGSQEVIVLRIWSGLTLEEIAEVAGCSVSTAHRRYRRALEELREILESTSCPKTSTTNCPKS